MAFSEIGFPFLWTEFLTTLENADNRKNDKIRKTSLTIDQRRSEAAKQQNHLNETISMKRKWRYLIKLLICFLLRPTTAAAATATTEKSRSINFNGKSRGKKKNGKHSNEIAIQLKNNSEKTSTAWQSMNREILGCQIGKTTKKKTVERNKIYLFMIRLIWFCHRWSIDRLVLESHDCVFDTIAKNTIWNVVSCLIRNSIDPNSLHRHQCCDRFVRTAQEEKKKKKKLN